MDKILNEWLYGSKQTAEEMLKEYSMQSRNDMAAKIKAFGDWFALQNSRALNETS